MKGRQTIREGRGGEGRKGCKVVNSFNSKFLTTKTIELCKPTTYLIRRMGDY
jgi:hypothetical protein